MSKTVEIPRWQLEAIEDALRLTANVHQSRNITKKGRTCFDRKVRQAELYAQNALKGQSEKRVGYV